ncbi:Hypothetical protein IALB_1742 [Ignavibacterium album JCM 16511]|uniref:Uncharacterized protein n=1 Tax=Ignavibacterium album (strain DSM 19864 / JCM 16511 / NBRC 101810 / Mat9-16) TaxID=945713 RepID=I0AKE2_IGNAJ|nr:hypothetical protein [Ignavibacterium album]AFH49449.1 Hypothetical protein IALB_1742 [Ignavibacterium album JCM 16511]
MNLKIFLPHKFKFVGLILFLLGIVSAYLRFSLGIKPTFLTIPVFSVYSSFLETKTFQFITNNISEEIVTLLLLIGLLLLNFSKEKTEIELTDKLRLKALISSIFVNTLLMIFCTLFIFGFAFVNVLMINLFSQLLLYQIIFRFLIFRNRNKLFADGIS